jgi:hypothetical protein
MITYSISIKILMKRLVLQFLIFLIPIVIFSQNKPVNHILIIDRTRSMLGEGDGKSHGNIWPRVQNALQDYCNSLKKGDRLAIYTFDAQTYGPEIFNILDAKTDIETAQKYIGTLKATGIRTGLKNALTFVLNQWDTTNFYNWMFIFTDGNDNVTPKISFDEISKQFKLKKQDFDFGYLVTLGANITEIPREGGLKVIEEANVDDLRKILKVSAEREQRIQDSLKTKEKRRIDSLERVRKCDSVTIFCKTYNGEIRVDKIGNCYCELPLPLWKKIMFIVIGLLFLCLIWIFWIKRILFPIFERGEIQIPNIASAEKFAGFKKIYLGKQAKVANNLLKSLFIGKDGHLLKDLDFSGEISLQKYKGKTWGILKITSPNININQQGRMYNYNPDNNDGIYILSREGNTFAAFNYLNVQNQRQI